MASVTIDHVVKVFPGGVRAVDDVSLEIRDQEFIALLGPSGCGKTTLLRMIAGLEMPTSGVIQIGDRVVNYVPPKDRDVAMVFQNYALYPHWKVKDNITLGLRTRHTPRPVIDERLTDAGALLGVTALFDRMPRQLSGGQQQRVALGRAIVREPKVFLMDEPLSNLDARLRLHMRAELIKLHRRLGTTIIYVTHDQGEAMTMATRVAVMKAGVIHQVDTPLNVYRHPANRYVAAFMGSPEMNFLEATVESEDGSFAVAGNGFRVLLPSERSATLANRAGGRVLLGIRPEELALRPGAGATAALPAVADIVEPIGGRSVVYGVVGDATVVAEVPANDQPKVDEAITFSFDAAKLHAFDLETEEALW
jgi:multiple sugar transport system ATP-binding protein